MENDYENLQERLITLPDKLSYDIMVYTKRDGSVCFCTVYTFKFLCNLQNICGNGLSGFVSALY